MIDDKVRDSLKRVIEDERLSENERESARKALRYSFRKGTIRGKVLTKSDVTPLVSLSEVLGCSLVRECGELYVYGGKQSVKSFSHIEDILDSSGFDVAMRVAIKVSQGIKKIQHDIVDNNTSIKRVKTKRRKETDVPEDIVEKLSVFVLNKTKE